MNRPVVTSTRVSAVDARRVYLRLLRYAWPDRGRYLLGVLGMLMYSGCNLAMLWFIHYFFNDQFLEHNSGLLLWLPPGLIGLFVIRGGGDFLSNYFPARVGRGVIKKIRGDLFAHYLRLPTCEYDRDSTANMLTRLTYNTELVASATADSLTVLIRDTVAVLGSLAYMVYMNWRLALASFVTGPLIAVIVRKINQRFRRYAARIQNSMGDVTRVGKEAFDAHRVVKVFNAQEHVAGLFESANELNRHTNVRLFSARASANPIVQLVSACGMAGVLYFAVRELDAHTFNIADFVTFAVALMQVPQPLRRLMSIAAPLQQGIAAGASVFEVIDAPTEGEGGARPLSRARGDVEFRDVSFKYSSAKGLVLRHINLSVPAGSTVAIVGRSGSGKSTLVSLLPRFYDPASGTVLVDGVDVRDYRLTDLRRQISLVSQEVVLFNETIRNNILFGLEQISEARLQAVARAAFVLEFAEQLPQGLDTMVGDRGVLLSGGQRQRIAIARALLRDTPILILDEATSALDTAAERHIQSALDQLVRNRTTFVIAHRLSTIEHADRILVMRDGALVESGAHAQLMQQRGAYAELHRLQFSA